MRKIVDWKWKGGKITVYRGTDEYDEANFIVENINILRREEYMTYNDFAGFV